MEKIVTLLLKMVSMPWWGWLILIVGIVLIIAIIKAIIKSLGKGVLATLKAICLGIFYIISLPFRAIIAIFRAIFGRKSKNKNSEVKNDQEDQQKE